MPSIAHSPAPITTKDSPRPFVHTVTRLVDLITARGMKVFIVVDQAAEARTVGLQLRPTTLVVFGNSVAGTGVMAAAPLAALDLPLKALVWADGDQTKVSYLSPDALAARYQLGPDVAHNLSGIDPLTDALVAPWHPTHREKATRQCRLQQRSSERPSITASVTVGQLTRRSEVRAADRPSFATM